RPVARVVGADDPLVRRPPRAAGRGPTPGRAPPLRLDGPRLLPPPPARRAPPPAERWRARRAVLLGVPARRSPRPRPMGPRRPAHPRGTAHVRCTNHHE